MMNTLKQKRILITGGAGFIGSNLANELVDGNNLTIIDDLSTGRMENIADLVGKSNVRFISGNILDLKLLQETFKDVDLVFHLAAIYHGLNDIILNNDTNITGTLNVLTAARDNKVKKVIFASSAAIYGDNPTLPETEDMPPNPTSPYALSKLAGEYYCRIFQDIYGLSTVCLRYFNPYGPKQHLFSPAALVPIFISRVLQGQPPIVYGDGKQTRDFVFVRDVVQANILAAASESTGIFNIGTGSNTTVYNLAESIIRMLCGNLRPILKEQAGPGVRGSLACTSKAKTIGYEPMYTLDEGLKETIRWYKNIEKV
jgi:UDP-glucose 4-epimerase